jgi:hypothetical protein
VLFLVAQVVMLLAAAVSLGTAGQRANGRLMATLAGVYSLWDLLGAWSAIGPAAFLSGLVYWPVATMFGHLLLRWPGGTVAGRPERSALAVGYGVLPLITLAWQLLWDRAWFDGAARHSWWLTVLPNRALAYGLWFAGQIVFLVLVVAFLVLIGRRLLAADPLERRGLVPIAVSSALLGAATIVGVWFGLDPAFSFDPALLQNLAVLTVPASVLVASRRGRAPHLVGHDHPGVVRWHRLPLAWLAIAAGILVLGVMIGASALALVSADTGAPLPQPGPPLAPVPSR